MDSKAPETKRTLEARLKREGIWLERTRGQCFLIDHNLLRAIASQANLGGNSAVLEVGSGSGFLTRHLAEKAGRVWAVENDERLVKLARETLSEFPNIEWMNAGILAEKNSINPSIVGRIQEELIRHPEWKMKVVSNPPYSIASPMVLALLESALPVEEMVLVLQEEVALRIAARPGSRAYGILTLLVQATSEVKIERSVPASVFWPRPAVASRLIRIIPRNHLRSRIKNYEAFVALVKALFQQRRKTLISTFRKQEYLSARSRALADASRELRLDLKRRAEELSVEEIIELSNRTEESRES